MTVPVLVDRVTAPLANAFAAYQLQACFGSPNPKKVVPGWPARAVLRRMNWFFDESIISERPTVPGAHVWRALVTPYRSTGSPNPAATVESRAIQLLPVKWTLSGSYSPTRQAVSVSGALTEGGRPVVGHDLVIWTGTALSAKSSYVHTDDRGSFSDWLPTTQTSYFRASGAH
jgi:hypothetical protein